MSVLQTALNLLSSSTKKNRLLIKREELLFILKQMDTEWAMMTGLLLKRGCERHLKQMKISDRFKVPSNSIKSRCHMKVCSLKLKCERRVTPEF